MFHTHITGLIPYQIENKILSFLDVFINLQSAYYIGWVHLFVQVTQLEN
jgi:hypothetical protein